MNIKDAKEQIKNAMTVYFTRDEFGNYAIPIERQRPVFLMGPPGIGKTAIMEQIAQELGVALVSYSMTHHTRQSALGLPFITRKNYGGTEYEVSEYTMSEIIASVYDMIEQSGKKEGILFLDEINCVSETLAPVMLQFLQYKIFGRHRVPDGWIVVTAGNPPEYNKSVREYDIATWDRLKRIDVEPDYKAWQEYALNKRVHQSILSYLEIKKSNFYKVETTVEGKFFVTARGWEDLSEMITYYEKNDIKVDLSLIAQYIQEPHIAEDFAAYYELFAKYRSDYQIPDILKGNAAPGIVERAKEAKFDERHSLLGLIIYGVTGDVRDIIITENVMKALKNHIGDIKEELTERAGADMRSADPSLSANMGGALAGENAAILPADIAERFADSIINEKSKIEKAAGLSEEKRREYDLTIAALKELQSMLAGITDKKEAIGILKTYYASRLGSFKEQVAETKDELKNAFEFCDAAFTDGQEILIFVTELTKNKFSAQFISRYGCDEYFAHNKELLFYERQQEIISELSDLGI
ncbi:MAG: MoxR family ATPase [Lachnospiraceae bacterium]|nr:MoxR family ATPase [Lachnospiraceae bacterium]